MAHALKFMVVVCQIESTTHKLSMLFEKKWIGIVNIEIIEFSIVVGKTNCVKYIGRIIMKYVTISIVRDS